MLSLSCFRLFEQHLVCYCSRSPRDSGGEDGWSCLFQTFKVLCDLHQISSHNTHRQIHRPSYSESTGDNTLIYNIRNITVQASTIVIKYLKLFPLTSLIVEVELEVNSSVDKLPLF